MANVINILVRLIGLGAVIAAYALLVVPHMGEKGDPNIGAGLIGFALIIVIAFAWALRDARHHPDLATLAWWAVVAVAFAVGWHVLMWAALRDAGTAPRDVLVTEASLMVYIAGFVLVPAGIGTAIGRASRSR
jgi:cation transport ATPase